jgi:DNA-binding GntR family transcriptional regulator
MSPTPPGRSPSVKRFAPQPGSGNAAGADARGGGVQRRVLRDSVHEAILEMLLAGRVVPGESLAIDGLARQLGVSPTPVREALGQLEHTGLVTRAALKGYRVSPPLSPARMAQLMDARAIVEVAAVRRAMPVAPEVIAELETVSKQHRSAAHRVLKMMERHPGRLEWATLRKYYTIDWNFHLIFLRNCGNPYLPDMAERLAPYLHRLRQSMNQGAIDVQQAVAEHAAILEAVRRGDAESAVAAMEAHLGAVGSRALADG